MNGSITLHPTVAYSRTFEGETHSEVLGGITVRQHFACEFMKQRLKGVFVRPLHPTQEELDEVARFAVQAADALLKALP